jgi:hypothetical protein
MIKDEEKRYKYQLRRKIMSLVLEQFTICYKHLKDINQRILQIMADQFTTIKNYYSEN